MAHAIGIDIGSYKTVMGIVKAGGVEVVLSDTSARSVPTAVAYTEAERLAGESVKTQIRRNFKNSVQYPTRFLGLNAACHEQIKIEKRFVTHKVNSDQATSKLSFPVTHMGDNHTFNIEQVMALFLVKVKEFYEVSGSPATEVILTVPSYASNVERQALYDAVEIAGLKCPRIINESTAIALNYGFFNRKDFIKEKPRTVAFVDFGHSKTTVTIAKFEPDKVKIVCHHSDRNLGGRDFDYLIMDKIGAEFDKKFGCDPREAPRCRLRMMEAAEKARKILSADTEAGINLDYLLEEEDLVRSLKRSEFEQIIEPVVTRFAKVLKETLVKSGINSDDLYTVELIGDGTRTPCIQEVIKSVFAKPQLSRTLNANECIARGASLQAAIISPTYQVAGFQVEDYNSLPVSMTYQFFGKTEADKQSKTMEIFPVGTSFPVTKTLSFKGKLGNMNLLLHYSENSALMTGLPQQMASYEIGEGKQKYANKQSRTEFVVKIDLNIHQIACLHSVDLKEQWTEIEKVPIKKVEPEKSKEQKLGDKTATKQAIFSPAKTVKKSSAQEYEKKEKIKTTVQSIAVEKTSTHAIPNSVKKQLFDIEQNLYVADNRFLSWKKCRNDLEAYSYEMRNNLDDYGSLVNFCEPNIRKKFLSDITETVEWLYAAGENAPLVDYEQRIAKFKEIGEPIKYRQRFHESLPDTKQAFELVTKGIKTNLTATQTLSEESRKQIKTKLQATTDFWNKALKDIQKQKKYEDPAITNEQALDKFKRLVIECNAIFDKPPPKAEKKEEKKEDVEMDELPASPDDLS